MTCRAIVLSLAAALLLGACAQAPVRAPDVVDVQRSEAAQSARERALEAMGAWRLVGRLAVSTDGRGGSGRVEWIQDGDDFDVRLSAPITRQGWRLTRTGQRVRLEGLDGGPREGADAEALLLEATGWRLPIDAMAAWVRGARGAGSAASVASDAQGRPQWIEQSGWRVEFPAWTADALPLPTRVSATQGEARVRLAIESWSATP